MSSCSTSSPSGGNKVKVEVEVEFSPVFDLLSLCLNNMNVGKVRHDPATGVSHVLVKSRVFVAMIVTGYRCTTAASALTCRRWVEREDEE